MKSFQRLTEDLESAGSTRHLDTLVRAGLIDKTQLSRLHRVLEKMSSGTATFTGKDRDVLYELLQRLVSLVTDNPQLYAKTLQTVRAESVQIEEMHDDTVDSHGIVTTSMPPAILILKRKQIRSYGNEMYVALYHNDRLNRFFSIPYQHEATVESWTGLLELIAEQETDSMTDLTCTDGTVFQVTPTVAQTTLRMIKQVAPALQESLLTHLMESATSFGQTAQFLFNEDAQVSEKLTEEQTTQKKYTLTKNMKSVNGHTLYQIQALKNFKNIKTGDLGGWIKSEKNLSQDGTCWVKDNAEVSGTARVFGNAKVFENAQVSEDSWVFGDAWVFGKARVFGESQVSGNAWVFENAEVGAAPRKIFGTAEVFGNAKVYGKAEVSDKARVYGKAEVSGNAKVSGDAWVFENAWVNENAEVTGNARVNGDAIVTGHAKVTGMAEVSGNAKVSDKALVSGTARLSGQDRASGSTNMIEDAQTHD